jgi:hypothetical protein
MFFCVGRESTMSAFGFNSLRVAFTDEKAVELLLNGGIGTKRPW